MASSASLITVVFRNHVMPNEAESKRQGRPIFEELEVCDMTFAANPKTRATFPAHEAEPNATREAGQVVTYAQVYNDQYKAYKAGETQPLGGTPLSEAPFLTESKRRELKALSVHTVEALAALDGTPLKQLGMGGREMKNQAQAYLDNAAGSADITALAAQNVSLQQQLDEMREMMRSYGRPAPAIEPPVDEPQSKALEDCTNAELKEYIKEASGEAVKGNPSRQTLIDRAMELATRPEGA